MTKAIPLKVHTRPHEWALLSHAAKEHVEDFFRRHFLLELLSAVASHEWRLLLLLLLTTRCGRDTFGSVPIVRRAFVLITQHLKRSAHQLEGL